jgi:hypothetical protein
MFSEECSAVHDSWYERMVFFYWCSNIGFGFQLEHLSVHIVSVFGA